ncbi:MAG: hypothetical protein QNJ71_05400 [Acidimicrobiia bacterium]|nr:hypothetical protein [Acidimicrobiia bacterium]
MSLPMRRMPLRRALVLGTMLVLAASSCSDTAPQSAVRADLDLRPDGIGLYLVGQPADEVIAGLSESIGGPDGDTDEPASPIFVPDCGAPGTRVVSWGSLALYFVERNGASVFETWSYGYDPITGSADDTRNLGLATEEGIGLGSSRDALTEAYGLRLQFDDDVALDFSTFEIDAGQAEHLAGRMDTTSPEGVVQFLERRPACEIPGSDTQ